MQGALIGAGATGVGALIGFFGAHLQGRAALEAVRMQVRGQRYDARWNMQREAYATLFSSVEQARTAVGHVYAAAVTHRQHPDHATVEPPSSAREALNGVLKEMWLQHSLLRLSVTPTQMAAADSLVEQLNGVVHDLDAWMASAVADDLEEPVLKQTLTRHMSELRGTVEWSIDTAKGYLDVAPNVDRPRRSLWRRLWDAYQEWRLGDDAN